MKYIPLQLGLIYLVNHNLPIIHKKIYYYNIHSSLYSKNIYLPFINESFYIHRCNNCRYN